MSKLQRSIKTTDDGVHLSVPVTVFSLFSLIKRSRHRCSLTGALRRQEVSIIGGLIYSIRWVSEARWRLLRNYYICFQTSLSQGEPRKAHSTSALIGGFMRAESGQSQDEPQDITTLLRGHSCSTLISAQNKPDRGNSPFSSPSCRNSWKMTPVLEVQRWCLGFAFHQNMKAERVSDVDPTSLC